jgi:hypothetical protein
MRGVVADWTVFVGIRSRPVKVDVGDDDIGYSCLAGNLTVSQLITLDGTVVVV